MKYEKQVGPTASKGLKKVRMHRIGQPDDNDLHMSPLGDHTTRKTWEIKPSCTVERRPGQIHDGHDMTEDTPR